MLEFSDPKFSDLNQGGAPLEEAEVVVIALHPRYGHAANVEARVQDAIGDADDVAYFVPEAIRHVDDGIEKSWFQGDFTSADDPELIESIDAVVRLIEALGQEGIEENQIVLVGYSQGATLTNEIIASRELDLRAVVSWHSSLVGPMAEAIARGEVDPQAEDPFDENFSFEHIPESYVDSLEGQDIYLEIHEDDPRVDFDLVRATAEYYRSLGAHVNFHVDEGRSHRPTEFGNWRLGASINYNLDDYQEFRLADGRFAGAGLEVSRADESDSRILVEIYDKKGVPVTFDNLVIESDRYLDIVDVDMLENGVVGVFYTESIYTEDVGKIKVAAYNQFGMTIINSPIATDCIVSTATVDRIDDLITVGYTRSDDVQCEQVFNTDAQLESFSALGSHSDDRIVGLRAPNDLNGLQGNDTLIGSLYDDTLLGGRDADDLQGGAGDDLLKGQQGNDSLTGGSGMNRLVGQGGADHFIFTGISATDIIADFQVGIDKVVVDSNFINNYSDIVELGEDEYGRFNYMIGDTQVISTGEFTEADVIFI